jgi:hypothetical protein
MNQCNCGGFLQGGAFVHTETCERNHQEFKKIYEAISEPIVESDLPDTLELMDWYQGPLTKKRLAELRYKLAKARGMLISLINDEHLLAYEEILQILKETKDPL